MACREPAIIWEAVEEKVAGGRPVAAAQERRQASWVPVRAKKLVFELRLVWDSAGRPHRALVR